MTQGYIYVASARYLYYELSLFSAQSLKDCYPEASITLFTHECFVDDRADKLFDNIVTGIPIHDRAKMWCMARTPYDQTFYNDVDSQIVHPDISKVFDNLKDNDMYMCTNLRHTVADPDLMYIDKDQTIEPPFHGAVNWYNKTDLTIDFLNTWFDEFCDQQSNPWPYDWASDKWQAYDMFTLWKLVGGKYSEFDKYTNLISKGSRRFNATVVDGVIDKKFYDYQAPVVYQVPRSTFKNMYPYVYHAKERIANAPSLHSRFQTARDSLEFD